MCTNQAIRAEGEYANGLVEGAGGQVFAVAAPSHAVHLRRVALLLSDFVVRLKIINQLIHARSGNRHRYRHLVADGRRLGRRQCRQKWHPARACTTTLLHVSLP